jgi:uncharacterized protein (TIGR02996 family)
MTEEAAFLRAIAASPTDNTTRLVYADWLDERGDALSTVKANYLRTDVRLSELAEGDSARDPLIARLKLLATGPSTDWKAAVARVPLEHCELRWAFACPMKWEQLQETSDPRTRACGACRKEVRYCDTIGEARSVALSGGCVAVDHRVGRRPGDLAPHGGAMLMGVMNVESPRWVNRWRLSPPEGDASGKPPATG